MQIAHLNSRSNASIDRVRASSREAPPGGGIGRAMGGKRRGTPLVFLFTDEESESERASETEREERERGRRPEKGRRAAAFGGLHPIYLDYCTGYTHIVCACRVDLELDENDRKIQVSLHLVVCSRIIVVQLYPTHVVNRAYCPHLQSNVCDDTIATS